MALPDGFLDDLRDRLSIADVVSKRVAWDVRRSNPAKGDYWAPCPFHKEKTASFHVDDKKGYYYCFGCHAKGDAIRFVSEVEEIGFVEAVERLAEMAGLGDRLKPTESIAVYEPPTVIKLKDIILDSFTPEHLMEMGAATGWSKFIREHPRLLKSAGWRDRDYPANLMDLLTRMEEAKDGSIGKIEAYIQAKFPGQIAARNIAGSLASSPNFLGYGYSVSRNDVISVMMPFSPSFEGVYQAIKVACAETPLPVKRADEVWRHSAVINDILELINHSAVVICDMTGRNENVFYELGIAHAWSRPVVMLTQSKHDVPFDLQHLRYLPYLNNDEGHEKLKSDLGARLRTLVGRKRLPDPVG